MSTCHATSIDTWLVNVIYCWVALFTLIDCVPPHQQQSSSLIRRAIDSSGHLGLNGNLSQRQMDAGAILPVGEAFNLFQSYGLLAFNINVVPLVLLPTSSRSYTNGSTSQPYKQPLFQMTTHPVLDRKLYFPEIKRQQVNNPRVQQQVMERSVRLHLCPGPEALMTRLLYGFTIDGLQKPWWAFTASWKKHVLPRIYGVPANYLTDDYSFLLVRVEKRSIVGSINGSMLLEPDLLAKLPTQADAAGQAASVGSKSWRSAVDFFLQFGTHIISDYSTGDALFQLIVYNTSSLPSLTEKLVDLRSQVDQLNPANATKLDWSKLLVNNSPPVHIGKLQMLSGNRTLINWLEPRLALSNLPATLPSSIRLLGSPVLFNLFYRQMQPRAVLSMNLVSITKAIPETPRRQWLNDVLFNLLRMWEYNM